MASVALHLLLLVLSAAAAAAWSVERVDAEELHGRLRTLYHDQDMVALRQMAELVIAQRPEVARDPQHRSAFQYLGVANYALGDLDKAVEAFEKAVEVNSSDASSWLDLGNVYLFQREMKKAVAALEVGVLKLGKRRDTHILFKARNWMADWRDRDELLAQAASIAQESFREGFRTMMNPIDFIELPTPMLREIINHEHTQKSHGVEPPLHCTSAACLNLRSSPTIRVGFVSSDFGIHPVVTLIRGMLATLSGRDHGVTVYCFPLSEGSSWWKQNISRTVDYTISLKGKNAGDAAQIIRSHDIHILVDLNGHTVHSGLGIFRFRPAPVQISYLGYPMTTGYKYIDFVIGDPVVTPPDTAPAMFTEKLLHLPTHYIVNDYMQMFGHAFQGARSRLQTPSPIPNGTFVFATFSNGQKIDPPIFQAWMEILARVPSSVMWFLRYRGHDEVERNLRAQAKSYGVDGDRRILFTELAPWIDHIGTKRAADLILDTSLKNGHTTLIDALCAGVPVVSLEGIHMSNRAGSSALRTLDLDELAVNSLKEYVEVAVRLATRPGLYHQLRRTVEARRFTHALFDTNKYTASFERVLQSAWDAKKIAVLDAGAATAMHVFPSQSVRARAMGTREIPVYSALGDDRDMDDYEVRVQRAIDASKPIRLHIGGLLPSPDWWIVDVVASDSVDFSLDMANLYPFPDNSVAAIYASHVLEHCDYGVTGAVARTLREWRRVLQPGGTLYVAVPDLFALASLYVDDATTAQERVHIMRVLFGAQMDAHDVHKVGFDQSLLAAYLADAGFCDLLRVPAFDLFPDSSTLRLKGVPISLNVRARAC